MGFLLFPLGTLSLGIAFVLWRLSKVEMINLAIRDPLRSEQEGKTYFTPLATSIRKKIALIIALLSAIGPLLIPILIVAGLVLVGLYSFLWQSSWIVLIIALLLLLILISLRVQLLPQASNQWQTPIDRLRDIPEILDEYREDYTGDVIYQRRFM